MSQPVPEETSANTLPSRDQLREMQSRFDKADDGVDPLAPLRFLVGRLEELRESAAVTPPQVRAIVARQVILEYSTPSVALALQHPLLMQMPPTRALLSLMKCLYKLAGITDDASKALNSSDVEPCSYDTWPSLLHWVEDLSVARQRFRPGTPACRSPEPPSGSPLTPKIATLEEIFEPEPKNVTPRPSTIIYIDVDDDDNEGDVDQLDASPVVPSKRQRPRARKSSDPAASTPTPQKKIRVAEARTTRSRSSLEVGEAPRPFRVGPPKPTRKGKGKTEKSPNNLVPSPVAGKSPNNLNGAPRPEVEESPDDETGLPEAVDSSKAEAPRPAAALTAEVKKLPDGQTKVDAQAQISLRPVPARTKFVMNDVSDNAGFYEPPELAQDDSPGAERRRSLLDETLRELFPRPRTFTDAQSYLLMKPAPPLAPENRPRDPCFACSAHPQLCLSSDKHNKCTRCHGKHAVCSWGLGRPKSDQILDVLRSNAVANRVGWASTTYVSTIVEFMFSTQSAMEDLRASYERRRADWLRLQGHLADILASAAVNTPALARELAPEAILEAALNISSSRPRQLDAILFDSADTSPTTLPPSAAGPSHFSGSSDDA